MRKVDLVARIAKETMTEKKVAAKVIDCALETIKETVLRGEAVSLNEFGVFETKLKKERMGRNLRTGEQVTIPAHEKVIFRASKFFSK